MPHILGNSTLKPKIFLELKLANLMSYPQTLNFALSLIGPPLTLWLILKEISSIAWAFLEMPKQLQKCILIK
jgi:hypothetical protein